MSTESLCIGRVVRASGLQGELRVQLFRPRRALKMIDWPINRSSNPNIVLEGPSQVEERSITRVRWIDPKTAVLKLQGVDTRSQAELLQNSSILIRSDQLPTPLTDDTDALIDGRAMDVESGADLGPISAIHDNGAQALLVIGEGSDAQWVPCVDEFIIRVERQPDQRAQVWIRLIPGLLDLR